MSIENKKTSDLHLLARRVEHLFIALDEIAGFELPISTKQKFMSVHASITAIPRLPNLIRLTVDGGSRRDWLTPFSEAVLGYVQEGLAACYYHLTNTELIERKILSIAKTYLPTIQIAQGSGIAGGNTRRLNFEYQAFVFALRRTLEYFAVSVGAFFKCDVHRIRTLAHAISGKEPSDISERIRVLVEESLQKLRDVLPPEDKERSVRDQLAHWRTVDAGVFNISHTYGINQVLIAICGGGENLHPWDAKLGIEPMIREEGEFTIMTLAPVLGDQISRVENLIFGVYSEMGLLSNR